MHTNQSVYSVLSAGPDMCVSGVRAIRREDANAFYRVYINMYSRVFFLFTNDLRRIESLLEVSLK